MSSVHVFVETGFLFGVFCVPSQRKPAALDLLRRYQAGELELHIPYVCFQEARHLISKRLPSSFVTDLGDFQQWAAQSHAVTWDFSEVKKFLDAAIAERSRTKANLRTDLAKFAKELGTGVIHSTREVFDCLEALELDADNNDFVDKLVLSSVLVKARALGVSQTDRRVFISEDAKFFKPADDRPKLSRLYSDAGLDYLSGFDLADILGTSGDAGDADI